MCCARHELRAREIRLPVIVLGSVDVDVGLGVRAMKAGASDFLKDPYERSTLLTAIASAFAELRQAGESDSVVQLAKVRVSGMSLRERQVLERMLRGGTNKSIARELGISPRTVEIHRARVMERLGAKTLSEAILLASSAGVRPLQVAPRTDTRPRVRADTQGSERSSTKAGTQKPDEDRY
jgi:FixJ family two-component response regulator